MKLLEGPKNADPKRFTRSKVTNGSDAFLDSVDGRSKLARRYRDIRDAIIEDLGGPENISEAQRQLVGRAAHIAVRAELEDAALVDGEAVDTESYCRLITAQTNIFRLLGIDRLAKDITPDLKTYMEEHQ